MLTKTQKNQIVTKPKKSNCEETQKLRLRQNTKKIQIQIVLIRVKEEGWTWFSAKGWKG